MNSGFNFYNRETCFNEEEFRTLCKKNMENNIGCIFGEILNECFESVSDVNVILKYTNKKEDIKTISNYNGFYIFKNIDINSKFDIYAYDNHGNYGEVLNVKISKLNEKINIKIKKKKNYSVILGRVLDCKSNEKLENIKIELFKKKSCNKYYLKYTCLTNEFGEFLIKNLELGYYIIRVTSNIYNMRCYSVKVNSCNKFINLTVYLKKKCILEKGCIYGLITDNFNKEVAEADVILYRVEDDCNLRPIKFTKANEGGMYYFCNLPIGFYKIKATKFLN